MVGGYEAQTNVENDQFFPDEVRDEGRKALQDNNIENELRVYQGVPHGMFALVGSCSWYATDRDKGSAFMVVTRRSISNLHRSNCFTNFWSSLINTRASGGKQ